MLTEPPLADSMTSQASPDDIKEAEDDASPQDDDHIATLSNIGRLQWTTEGVRNVSLQMDRELIRQTQSLDQVRMMNLKPRDDSEEQAGLL